VCLKQNEFVQLEDEIWLQLKALGLIPGTALYLNGVSVTKQRGFTSFNVACKWKRKYWDGHRMKDGLFSLICQI